MRYRPLSVFLVLAACAGGAVLAEPPAAVSPLQRPTTRTPDCTISGCHSAQTNHTFLHGPNAVQACDACHEAADVSKHTFELKRKGQELCNFCHIDKTGREGPVVHKPVADGQCLGCHDPHGSTNRQMLKKDTTVELCLDCHKTITSAAHVHGPAAQDCSTCHKSHTSDHKRLLLAEPRDLCINCHEDVGKSIAGSKHPHDPAKSDCLQCHNPHASDHIKALKKAPAELCASCHTAIADIAAHATHPHSAALAGADPEGRACLNCHTAHGSDHEKQLAKDPTTSCLECHAKPIKVAEASGPDKFRVVNAVTELSDETLHKHGPIERSQTSGVGGCSPCHDVHGGTRDHLLVGNYSLKFYQGFSDEAYELCFKCHNRQLAVAQPANNQTGFRDGTRNLHAIHVNPGGDKQGRSCRACHSMHASKSAAQINESVPFGQWKMPIKYAQTQTGGSCSPGCHKPANYDREKPAGPTPANIAPAGPSAPTPKPASIPDRTASPVKTPS